MLCCIANTIIMKRLKLKTLVAIASVLLIAGAAVSFAGSKNPKAPTIEKSEQVQTVDVLTASPEFSSGDNVDPASVKTSGQGLSYEQQGQMMRDRKTQHDQAIIVTDQR